MTIKARMILSFALMVVLFIVFGAISMNQMGILGDLTSTLYDHPLRVSNAALKAKSGIISMHRSMKDVSTSQNQMAITIAIQKVQSDEKKVYQELDVIQSYILGQDGKILVDETIQMFTGWKPIRLEVQALVLKGNTVAANKITREKGADYVIRLERQMSELTSYALNKADGFMKNANEVENNISKQSIIFVVVLILIAIVIGFFMSSSILSSVLHLKNTMTKITETGELSTSNLEGNNEITQMARHFNGVIEQLQEQFWIGEGRNNLNRELSGELTYDQILTKSIDYVSRYVDACAGALYSFNNKEKVCELKSSYAFVERKHLANKFNLGEGIVGQVAVEKKEILLKNIISQDAIGQSGTISEPPVAIYALPLFYEETLFGVLEIASFEEITKVKQKFLKSAANITSVLLYTASQNEQIKALLNTSQEANEKLQAQTEELQAQTEELQAMNEEFQQQSDELKEQNVELEAQRQQVEEANRLKSEFLSNMSHELRTPLNSVNALSRVLILQAKDKLSDEEVNYLEIIERNGKHLLALINDILDLSKIEAGKMDISLSHFSVKTLIENILESVEPLSIEKGIQLEQILPEDIPKIESDESKVFQILQNIIANGVKFTDEGSVKISAICDDNQIDITVSDTGVGISDTNFSTIFEEFRQVDGASTRKFEGTGLGLAIAYKTAKMLGGDIRVESSLGIGSEFTISLPIAYEGPKKILETLENRFISPVEANDKKEDKTILVVDDDPKILKMISDAFDNQGYKTLTAQSGKEALKLAQEHRPFAITLDVLMPEMDGWEVLNNLKKHPLTSSIPVIIVSVSDDRATGFALGAVGSVTKPIDKNSLINEINKIYGYLPSSVMIVDDSEFDRQQTSQIIMAEGMKVVLAENGEDCLGLLEKSLPDVLVLDLVMPGMNGFEVLERIRAIPATNNLPVIIVTAKDLSSQEKKKLENNASSILLKSETSSAQLMESIKNILVKIGKKGLVLSNSDKIKKDKIKKDKILLIEDNDAVIIQVKSAIESIGIPIDVAQDGQQGLNYIRHTIPKGIILDLMMPNIDGFEVLESIRGRQETKDIPVLILTAKNLTKEDLSRLSANNVQQLIQKGDVDREGLLHKVKNMIHGTSLPYSQKNIESPNTSVSYTPINVRDIPSILIVEDNPDNMTTIKAIIGTGYSIEEAIDGEQGLHKAIKLLPDLILLDISLPVMDGLSVLKELKMNEQTTDIPIIALTAQAMKGDKEKLIQSGCDDYIAKPIDPEKIILKLNKWLSKES